HHHVTRCGMRFDLARKDEIETVIVADSGQYRGVGGEGQRRKRPALQLEAPDDLRGEVLRVGCRTAVTHDQKLVAASKGVHQKGDGALDGRHEIPLDRRHHLAVAAQLRLYTLFHLPSCMLWGRPTASWPVRGSQA